MIFNYLKIWLKVIKKHISLKAILKTVGIWLPCFVIIYFFTNRSLTNSIVILIVLLVAKLSIKIIFLYKELTRTDTFDLILLKPVDPLFGLIIYNRNPADILILLPILMFIKLRRYKR